MIGIGFAYLAFARLISGLTSIEQSETRVANPLENIGRLLLSLHGSVSFDHIVRSRTPKMKGEDFDRDRSSELRDEDDTVKKNQTADLRELLQSSQDMLQNDLNLFLDSPVIDPLQDGGRDEPKWLKNFKALAVSNYEEAEFIYAGAVFAVLIILSFQGIRIYRHCYFTPDKFCPWDTTAWDLLDKF